MYFVRVLPFQNARPIKIRQRARTHTHPKKDNSGTLTSKNCTPAAQTVPALSFEPNVTEISVCRERQISFQFPMYRERSESKCSTDCCQVKSPVAGNVLVPTLRFSLLSKDKWKACSKLTYGRDFIELFVDSTCPGEELAVSLLFCQRHFHCNLSPLVEFRDT